MLISFISLYFFSNLLIGWWASRRVSTTEDFVLAGRGLGFVLASMVTFATWFGSETMMGAPAEFVRDGFLGVIEEPFGAAMCLILVGLFYAKTFYRWNIITFCDFFKVRYGKSAEFLSAILIVPSYFGWIAAQLVALGVVLEAIIGLDLRLGISLSATLVMIYTMMGGMWSVSITDFIHNILLILGLIVLAVLLWLQMGSFQPIIAQAPPHFFRFVPETFSFQGIASYVAAWITVGLGSIPQQDIFQRVMSSKNETVAARSAVMAGCLYLTVAMLPLLIALIAKTLHPELLQQDPKMLIPNMVLRHTPLFVQILFFGALVSAILSTTSGAILAPSAVIGENLVKPYWKNSSDKQLLLVIRLSVVGVTIVCVWMALVRQDIFSLVGESSAFSLVSLFVPLTAGLAWQRANLWGCLASMAIGWGVWFGCYLANTEIPAVLYGLSASAVGMVLGTWVSMRVKARL